MVIALALRALRLRLFLFGAAPLHALLALGALTGGLFAFAAGSLLGLTATAALAILRGASLASLASLALRTLMLRRGRLAAARHVLRGSQRDACHQHRGTE